MYGTGGREVAAWRRGVWVGPVRLAVRPDLPQPFGGGDPMGEQKLNRRIRLRRLLMTVAPLAAVLLAAGAKWRP